MTFIINADNSVYLGYKECMRQLTSSVTPTGSRSEPQTQTSDLYVT